MLSALPLESRWQQVVDRRPIDIRLTAIAYHIGEKLHARLLDHDRLDFTFESLGLDGEYRKLAVFSRWDVIGNGPDWVR